MLMSKAETKNGKELTKSQAHPKGTDANLQMAEAGLAKLRDPSLSQFQALVKAGYSESTARNPGRNQLSVNRCIEEAWKLSPEAKPRHLLAKTRKLVARRLDSALANHDMNDVSLIQLAALAEKNYSDTSRPGDGVGDARSFAARCRWVTDLFAEMKKQGLEPVE